MKRIISINTVFILLIFIVLGCGRSETAKETPASDTLHFVQITTKQFESEGMRIGEPTLKSFADEVRCNGYIISPPNGMAQISTPLWGIVQGIYCSMGDYVRKGQVLCKLSSNEIMLLQQDFAETSANFKRTKSNYERSKSLFNENIGSEKDFLATESDYYALRSKYQSLKLRLELLQLNVEKIETGELYTSFPLTSPINGYITIMNIVLGQFTEQQKPLMEIVDAGQLQLQLSIFENDIWKLEPGQVISFSSLGETASVHSATLTLIGKTINPESKTIQCMAKIANEKGITFINRSYIEAVVKVDQKEAVALPNDALLKSGKDYFVYVVEKQDDQLIELRKIKVNIGRVSEGFTEIVGGNDLSKVLVRGVYNLPAD